MPTWMELVKAIREKPLEIRRPWISNPSWTMSVIAEKLFVQFLQQLWINLSPVWTDSIAKTSHTILQQAMESWTVEQVYSRLASVQFLPCNAKLKGAPRGWPERSFSEQFKMYFPDDIEPPMSSEWLCFWESPGYIREYHHILHNMDNDEDSRERLDADIQELFCHMQCLPNSQGYITSTGGIGVV